LQKRFLRNLAEFEAIFQSNKFFSCFFRIVPDPESKLLLRKLPIKPDKDIADVEYDGFYPRQASTAW
jgi:hypothetical protein